MTTALRQVTRECAVILGNVNVALGNPREHVWTRRDKYPRCMVCDIGKRAAGHDMPCPGKVDAASKQG